MAVIGLDGVGLPLVEDLTARGVMPRLGALLPAGTAAPMRSSIPTISSVSWTGFMTGQNPGKHGIYGFTDVKPGTLTTFFPNFGNVKSETLWDVAGRAGKRAIVLNVPNTYPARALNGLLVSGFVAVNLERAVYPPELLPRLREDGYKIDVDYLNADQRPDAFFADLAATLDARRRVYLRLLADEPWDLFIGVITECDRLHHYFWNQYVDPAAPHHARFLDFYRRLDDLLGALAEALPAGTPLFIVADHGHTLIHREFYPNAWLRAEGLLRFTSETPKGLADVDPASKVFVLDPGRVYVHRRGRFPLGAVGPAEAEDLLARVRAHATADGGERIGIPRDSVGLLKTSFSNHGHVTARVGMRGARPLTIHHFVVVLRVRDIRWRSRSGCGCGHGSSVGSLRFAYHRARTRARQDLRLAIFPFSAPQHGRPGAPPGLKRGEESESKWASR